MRMTHLLTLLCVGVLGCADKHTDPVSEADTDTDTDTDTDSDTDADTDSDTDTDTGEPDSDGDGVADEDDNCVGTKNADQQDTDKDGVGDACDNCAALANSDQSNGDKDGVGDACDNCPEDSNDDQSNADGDGFGDVCDDVVDFVVFAQALGADHTDPKHQDCITKAVCVTRAENSFLYNAVSETAAASYGGYTDTSGFYLYDSSPEGLQFRVGFAGQDEDVSWAGWLTLAYTYSLSGPSVTLQPAAMKLSDGSQQWNVMVSEWESGQSVYATEEDKKTGGLYGVWEQPEDAASKGFGWTRAAVVSFEKADGADYTDPVNQDCVSPSVCLTRGDSQSIFNAAQEASYSAKSPMGTEWAPGPTWDALARGESYGTFTAAVGGSPQDAIGEVLSLHLPGTSVYYDVVITGFTGGGPGGGFSWRRSRALVPGCMDPAGDNYDPVATVDIGYCDAEWRFFYRPPGVGSDSAYQDCLSDGVCIARADNQSIYNALTETEADNSVSPAGTLWYGTQTEAAAPEHYLAFRLMADSTRSVINAPVSMYDETDDAYHDVVFKRWQPGAGSPHTYRYGTGSFAYVRRAAPD